MVLKRSFVSASLIMALAACGGDDSSYSANDTNTFTPPAPVTSADPTIAGEVSYKNAVVHDPSIIKDTDGTYYVFGSHLAVASSTDLMNWTQIASDGAATSSLFNTYASEIAEGTAWTGGFVGSWAPDVIKLADGKYHFYYDFCGGPDKIDCVSRSYLGMATSDNILGPYVNKGLLLKSGHEGAENPGANGQIYDGNVDPNAIDPAVFYDKDGGLWMTYGSYSGGIWVMQLDPATGKPLADQGYGTKIMGGNYSAIEGSYVIYSPESEYYYMFTSFGGFAQKDGYNIRISRSKNPNGPYVDAAGLDMIGATAAGNIADYGVKLMGGFQFVAHPGDVGHDHGYLSPGHNSAFYDAQTGKYFLVFHTRFPDTDEGHSVRVHELFLNSDGWLVASPQRYAPINGDNIVDEIDVTGDYQFINHAKDINKAAHKSVHVKLSRTWTNKGTVSGDVTGTYQQGDDNKISLTLDNLGTFEGVLAWQWDPEQNKLMPTFSAISNDGASIWGVKLTNKTTEEILSASANGISLPTEVTEGTLALPIQGTRGATIEWHSSDESVIRADGTIIRPNVGEGDKVVTLTATIMVNGKKVTKTFKITVFAHKTYNRIAQYSFENNLKDSLGLFGDGQPTGDRIFKAGDAIGYATGFEGQALSLDGTHGVLLPSGIISSYEYTVSFWASPAVITGFTTAFFGAVNEQTAEDGSKFSNTWVSMLPQGWDGNTMFWSHNIDTSGSAAVESWFDGVTGERIAENTWSHLAFSVNKGLVKVFINGVERFSRGNLANYFTGAQGVFGLGVNYWDLPYNGLIDELKVYEAALTAEEVKALDIDKLADSELLSSATAILELGDLSAVRKNIELPVTGPYAAAISWVSSDPTTIDTHGSVTQPARGEEDKVVTLTATLKLGNATQTKVFTATVKAKNPPTPVAVYSFEDNLNDSTANFGAGTLVGNLIGVEGGKISYMDGAVGKAAVFDGASGIVLPNNLIKDYTYSVSMWLNPEQLNKYTTALFGYATDSSWTSVLPGGQNDYERMVLWSGTAWYDGRTGFVMPKSQWTHLAYTVNGGDVKVYINGELKFTGANFPNIFSVPTTKFAVGVNFWDTPFKGAIDEIKFYDEAITEQDVADLFSESNQ
ncbi:LamG-like jellyroll fold domain-containing protein [Shewanella xiamenensis]|uniref:LamG-like jellyroll fold domain-containing protein n=1 Tax=Shewanella xiamenensis TaxID=332186 RepID=UPI002E7BDC9E|nr:LamG-like jellyroll fold domain-containing protein [Shewanella xiamenensis]